MSITYEKMKFINFVRPTMATGKYTVSVSQKVTKPEPDQFTASEDFYVTNKAFTLDANQIFDSSPSENECGDFSKMLPFVTLDNKAFPWNWKIADDIGQTPVPWVALLVISSAEKAEEKDIPISELFSETPSQVYFPKRTEMPQVFVEKESDLCHIVELPKAVYESLMPSHEEMTYLTHVRRVNLANTEDSVAEKDGDFSVIMANRFIPTGETEGMKSTVHLVSLLGMPEQIPAQYTGVRLVSLYRWNVYSVKGQTETFKKLIEGLNGNKGVIGYGQENEVLKRCYVPKKHFTRSGECTYSLYRSPLIPYANKKTDLGSKVTADGHLIYDKETGVFDVTYAAAFQLGRLISLSHKTDGKNIMTWRKNLKLKKHKALLESAITFGNLEELCEKMIEEMS